MTVERHAFFSLLSSGLWERPVQLSNWTDMLADKVFRLAEEQSVVGLVAAGLEHVDGRVITKPQALLFMKKVFILEGRNAGMNLFIADLLARLREKGIHALLVKGQGIAQCYERPQWRAAGDVDLLLDAKSYEKAKTYLIPFATHVEKEYKDRQHLGMKIDSWSVELHGSMRYYRLGRVNACIDEAQEDTFRQGHFRIWMNGESVVELPSVDNDVIFVFTHILQHFFETGVGLRQICDWCRLLWTYRNEIDQYLLTTRLNRARLISEWEVLATLVVNYLEMPVEALPLYRKSAALDRKANRLMKHILRTGNFGHNRDSRYVHKTPYLVRKLISFWKETQNAFHRALIFPLDTVAFYTRGVIYSLRAVGRGE